MNLGRGRGTNGRKTSFLNTGGGVPLSVTDRKKKVNFAPTIPRPRPTGESTTTTTTTTAAVGVHDINKSSNQKKAIVLEIRDVHETKKQRAVVTETQTTHRHDTSSISSAQSSSSSSLNYKSDKELEIEREAARVSSILTPDDEISVQKMLDAYLVKSLLDSTDKEYPDTSPPSNNRLSKYELSQAPPTSSAILGELSWHELAIHERTAFLETIGKHKYVETAQLSSTNILSSNTSGFNNDAVSCPLPILEYMEQDDFVCGDESPFHTSIPKTFRVSVVDSIEFINIFSAMHSLKHATEKVMEEEVTVHDKTKMRRRIRNNLGTTTDTISILKREGASAPAPAIRTPEFTDTSLTNDITGWLYPLGFHLVSSSTSKVVQGGAVFKFSINPSFKTIQMEKKEKEEDKSDRILLRHIARNKEDQIQKERPLAKSYTTIDRIAKGLTDEMRPEYQKLGSGLPVSSDDKLPMPTTRREKNLRDRLVRGEIVKEDGSSNLAGEDDDLFMSSDDDDNCDTGSSGSDKEERENTIVSSSMRRAVDINKKTRDGTTWGGTVSSSSSSYNAPSSSSAIFSNYGSSSVDKNTTTDHEFVPSIDPNSIIRDKAIDRRNERICRIPYMSDIYGPDDVLLRSKIANENTETKVFEFMKSFSGYLSLPSRYNMTDFSFRQFLNTNLRVRILFIPYMGGTGTISASAPHTEKPSSLKKRFVFSSYVLYLRKRCMTESTKY
jgi:hypothetical protein